MPILLKLLTSREGLVGMAIAAVLALFGVQELRLKLADIGEAHAKAALATAEGRVSASERFRDQEHAAAVKGAGDAEAACAARVALALKSGAAIRKITGAPVALDPATHCPLRSLVPDGELRDALQPR